MDFAITKMSSKGQIVIPSNLRNEFNIGDKLLIIKNDHKLIIKKASEMEKNLQEDLEFARRTEEAWKKFEKGEFISMDSEDFLKEIEKW